MFECTWFLMGKSAKASWLPVCTVKNDEWQGNKRKQNKKKLFSHTIKFVMAYWPCVLHEQSDFKWNTIASLWLSICIAFMCIQELFFWNSAFSISIPICFVQWATTPFTVVRFFRVCYSACVVTGIGNRKCALCILI